MACRFLILSMTLALCLSPLGVLAQGDETTTLRAQSEAFAQRLTDEGCEPAMSDWRAQIIAGNEDVSQTARMMGVMAAFEQTEWGPCFAAPNDRAFVAEGLMALAVGPSPQGRVFGTVLLRESLGVTWRDQLAMTGSLPFQVQAAEAHIFCAEPEPTAPNFVGSEAPLPVGLNCDESGIGDPSLATGLLYLALALETDAWDGVQTALTAPAVLMMTALTEHNWDMDAVIAANQARGLEMTDPRADAAILRSVYKLLFDEFGAGKDAEMVARAQSAIDEFVPQPLDLRD